MGSDDKRRFPKGSTSILKPESKRYGEIHEDFYGHDAVPPATPPAIVQFDYRFPRMRWYLLVGIPLLLLPFDLWGTVFNVVLCVCAFWWFYLLSINCVWFAFDDETLRIRNVDILGRRHDVTTIRKSAIAELRLKSSLWGNVLTIMRDESPRGDRSRLESVELIRDSSNDQDLNWLEGYISEWLDGDEHMEQANSSTILDRSQS